VLLYAGIAAPTTSELPAPWQDFGCQQTIASLLECSFIDGSHESSRAFACHYYMSRVPVLREMVLGDGSFPLDAPRKRQTQFFQQSR